MKGRLAPTGQIKCSDLLIDYDVWYSLINGSFIFFYFLFFLILKSLILTCVPKHEPPSHPPPHNISLGHPHAPAPSKLHPTSDMDRIGNWGLGGLINYTARVEKNFTAKQFHSKTHVLNHCNKFPVITTSQTSTCKSKVTKILNAFILIFQYYILT